MGDAPANSGVRATFMVALLIAAILGAHDGAYWAPTMVRPYKFRRTGDLYGRPFKCGDIGRPRWGAPTNSGLRATFMVALLIAGVSGAHGGAPLPFIHHFIHAHHLLHDLVHSFGGTI
jgi:hypothetical protein